jgi:hypothetical protein
MRSERERILDVTAVGALNLDPKEVEGGGGGGGE